MNRTLISVLSGSALCVMALLAWASAARAQDGPADLPPHVIDVAPFPGEETPTGAAVTVTFDQPMDRASVEAAWDASSAAPGAFTWAADDRSVSYLPAGGWPRAARTPITIGTGAQAANGLALEEAYEFFVQTVGRLEVGAVIPAPDAQGVAADATITVSFNRPVVPLVATDQIAGLPDPLVIEPAVEGRGEWVNTSIYVFTPSKALAGGTTYTARVPAGLVDVTGAVLEDDYIWQFSTLAPEVLSVYPYQGATEITLDTPISIAFSQPMDRASAEAAFTLSTGGEPVAGRFTWSDDARSLIFTPDERLAQEATYSIGLASSARAASGEAGLREGLTYNFRTIPYPRIDSTSPANGQRDVYPGGGVSFHFSTPMNTDTFEGKVEILEPAGVEWEPVVNGDRDLYLDFATQPETSYTILFRAGAQDIYGNAIAADYTLSFRTGAIEPWASLPYGGGRIGLTSAYREDTRLALSV
ncbi:MAG: Ig-like domain-containing protein, partial [Chloroflexota bacterium]